MRHSLPYLMVLTACVACAIIACSRIEGDQRLAEQIDAGADFGEQAPLTPDNACLNESYGVERVRLALFLLVDRSGSTRYDVEPAVDEGDAGVETTVDSGLGNVNRWDALTQAISKFVRGAALEQNVLLGLQFFPLEAPSDTPYYCAETCRTCGCVFACGCNGCQCTSSGCRCTEGTYSCSDEQYGVPAVPFTEAASAVSAIENSLAEQIPKGATPTRPALLGALRYARSWAREHPLDKAVLVMATDGVPSSSLCTPNTIADNVRIVSAAAHSSPRVPTFVIGVGGALEVLNEIAAAGTTEQAFLVDTQTELENRFFEILESTRRTALPCQFELPTPKAGAADPERVKLSLGPKHEPILRVADRAACSAVSGGFHYDSSTEPRELVLCPASCASLRNTAGSTLELLMACKSPDPR